MGGTTEEVRTKIKTKVEVAIKQETEQYMDLVNQKMTSVMNGVAQSQKSSVKNTIGVSNTIILENITIEGGSIVDITQINEVKYMARAIVNVSQSSELMTEVINMTKQQVSQEMAASGELTTNLKAAAESMKSTKSEGEFNSFMKTIENIISGIAGKESKEEAEIEQEVRQTLEQSTLQKTSISDLVNNTFKSDFSQDSVNECGSSTSVGNTINIKTMVVRGGSSFTAVQQAMVEQLQDCILTATLSVTALTYLKNSSELEAGQKASLDAKSTLRQDLNASSKNLEENRSYLNILTDLFDKIGFIVIIVVAVIALIILFPMISGMMKSKSGPPAYNLPPISSSVRMG